MAIYNASKAICYARGDTTPITFAIKKAGVAVDITGFTLEFAVNPNRNPLNNTAELFRLSGVITDAVNGLVEFRPTDVQTDQTPKKYYYDLQQIDGGGYKRTLLKSIFEIEQDINKT